MFKRLKLIKLWLNEFDTFPFNDNGQRWRYLEGKKELGYKLNNKELEFIKNREAMITAMTGRINREREKAMQGIEPQPVDLVQIVKDFGGF